jgi:hypothetical protein
VQLKKVLDGELAWLGAYAPGSATRRLTPCCLVCAAVKDLITDANFDCNEDGIVRVPLFPLCPFSTESLSL